MVSRLTCFYTLHGTFYSWHQHASHCTIGKSMYSVVCNVWWSNACGFSGVVNPMHWLRPGRCSASECGGGSSGFKHCYLLQLTSASICESVRAVVLASSVMRWSTVCCPSGVDKPHVLHVAAF
jgi:hypothetical protein